MAKRLRSGDTTLEADVRLQPGQAATLLLDGTKHAVTEVSLTDGRLVFSLDGQRLSFDVLVTPAAVWVAGPQGTMFFERAAEGTPDDAGTGGGSLHSKMPGVVLQTLVEPGAAVEAGTPLLILEAMKMEHQVVAPEDGLVKDYPVAVGQRVMPGDLLVHFEPRSAV